MNEVIEVKVTIKILRDRIYSCISRPPFSRPQNLFFFFGGGGVGGLKSEEIMVQLDEIVPKGFS